MQSFSRIDPFHIKDSLHLCCRKTHWFQTWTAITESLTSAIGIPQKSSASILRNNYHNGLTTTNTTWSYTYHSERHGRRKFASFFTPPLAFSIHYIIILWVM